MLGGESQAAAGSSQSKGRDELSVQSDGLVIVSDTLLDRMERALTDAQFSTSELLRMCVLLGGQTGSAALRDWARLELDGYEGADGEVPTYRKVSGILMVDWVTASRVVSQQPIDPLHLQLPNEMRDSLRGPVVLAQPLAELERLAMEGIVKIAPPGMTVIVALANRKSAQSGQAINSLYWAISAASVAGVVDRVRTQLAALTAELRSVTPQEQAVPSAASADRAIQVVILGEHRGSITIERANLPSIPISMPAPAKWQKVLAFFNAWWGWLVGLATILGLYVATATWQGWTWPWP